MRVMGKVTNARLFTNGATLSIELENGGTMVVPQVDASGFTAGMEVGVEILPSTSLPPEETVIDERTGAEVPEKGIDPGV